MATPDTGSHDIVATFSGTANFFECVATSVTGNFGGMNNSDTLANGDNTTQTITVTSSVDDYVVDAFSCPGAIYHIATTGATRVYTKIYSNDNRPVAGSTAAGAATVSMGWTMSNTNGSNHILVAANFSAGAQDLTISVSDTITITENLATVFHNVAPVQISALGEVWRVRVLY
jgi:hypothetical protein